MPELTELQKWKLMLPYLVVPVCVVALLLFLLRDSISWENPWDLVLLGLFVVAFYAVTLRIVYSRWPKLFFLPAAIILLLAIVTAPASNEDWGDVIRFVYLGMTLVFALTALIPAFIAYVRRPKE